MLSYDPTLSHHLEACPEAPSLQMGQPAARLLQRQQTDNLPLGRSDSHGVVMEDFRALAYTPANRPVRDAGALERRENLAG